MELASILASAPPSSGFFPVLHPTLVLPSATLSPNGSDEKESACNTADPGSIPGLERSPGERNGNHSSFLAWRIP